MIPSSVSTSQANISLAPTSSLFCPVPVSRMANDNTSSQRFAREGPFCWQSKNALSRIEDACDSRTDKAYVLAVYLALTWHASNCQAQEFKLEKRKLAARAGVGYRKVADILNLLAEIGLISSKAEYIEGSLAQGPNTYTMHSACMAPCMVSTPPMHGSKNAAVPRLGEESSVESSEQSIAPDGAAGEEMKSNQPGIKAQQSNHRDPALHALAALDGADPAQVTRSAWGAIAKALKEIRSVCPTVTAEEIKRRALNYRVLMPTAMLTASALAKHWSACDCPPAASNPSPQSNRNYQPFKK
jgi:hypothetical protein